MSSYRERNAARWFRERVDAAEGTERDPFEPIPGAKGFHRIRKRSDGACGFLSPANRCRLHEELGGRLKPLTCRLFPFSFHPVNETVAVTTSFACPTIVANEGAPIATGETVNGIKSLSADWFKAYPESPAALYYVAGRPLGETSMKILRTSLLQMLDRADANGRVDLRTNVIRIARTLEDLARPAVVRLKDDEFAEYIALTAPFAARTDKPAAARAPSWSARLMQRGFLSLNAATQLRIENKAAGDSSIGLRLRTFKLFAHFHGLAGGVGRFDRSLGRGVDVDVNGPDLQPVIQHYLRSSIQTMGTGVRPVVDELAVAVASLNAACALAKMKAAAAGRVVDRRIFSEALVEAADVTHADYGLLARVLTLFAGGVESLYTFGNEVSP
jgi:Fe-S-cluster containining protein